MRGPTQGQGHIASKRQSLDPNTGLPDFRAGAGTTVPLPTGLAKASGFFFFPSVSPLPVAVLRSHGTGAPTVIRMYTRVAVCGGFGAGLAPVIQLPLRTVGAMSADPQPQAPGRSGRSCHHVLEGTPQSTAGITPKIKFLLSAPQWVSVGATSLGKEGREGGSS